MPNTVNDTPSPRAAPDLVAGQLMAGVARAQTDDVMRDMMLAATDASAVAAHGLTETGVGVVSENSAHDACPTHCALGSGTVSVQGSVCIGFGFNDGGHNAAFFGNLENSIMGLGSADKGQSLGSPGVLAEQLPAPKVQTK
ncbi:hypothetical protein SPBR_07967 [Sporothrix brasiliensis 5110]|uniref:Uncharacterized protein n=1 Tax=Sporothrix brasiliensis 5110 TaxID=1398154 RepID=A0A0C2IJ16_9PEZI|nr:uncharacterized protein SPBR_07967 [Sporothrix brasiliensis 5110]KIH89126.1 hypothetical protein SPBR_07967 [Sporothrix brasiliensis 5110]